MTLPKVAAYGSWISPLTADFILTDSIGLGRAILQGEDIYWLELRPKEGGRLVLVKYTPDENQIDITPPPFNVRTRVHEYGGLCFTVDTDGTVYFSNFNDQRIYIQKPGKLPTPLTPENRYRYADPSIDSQRKRLVCVLEDHTDSDQEALNSVISLRLEDGGGQITLASGNDFYSNPRLNPEGNRLAWLTWNHPNMPWDGTELWVGNLDPAGKVVRAELVAGGLEESIFQPEWSPDGILYFVSDRSGWWNLYRWKNDQVEAVYPLNAEFGQPAWNFGISTYGFSSHSEIICSYIENGISKLARIDLEKKTLKPIPIPYNVISDVRVKQEKIILVVGSPTEPLTILSLNLATGQFKPLRKAFNVYIDPGYLSFPEVIEFPTENGLTAYGFFYPPKNKDFQGPANQRPPLIVKSHGGPTGATRTSLDLEIQYWTSRGFGVLDVNYGGSTGYGREYRQRLNDKWGIVDIDDCVNGALYLVKRGDVDGQRLSIVGGSAGGYTTLAALTFRNVFKVGASHFGVSDLAALARDTHKFESRYLDRMVGPYPEREDIYYARSPINFVHQLNCPLILFQGAEDKVVPPAQAETMFEAVKAKGLPVAYLLFEGEQHGFRKAENIKRSLEAELFFYSRIYGFQLAEPIEPVKIENL